MSSKYPGGFISLGGAIQTYSNAFSGSNYLSAPNNAAFAFGTGDFTIEAWIYPTSSSSYRTLFTSRNTTDTTAVWFGLSSGTMFPVLFTTSALALSTIATPLNTWSHVALVRSSGVSSIYVNGVLGASGADATNYTQANCTIGYDTLSAAYYWPGYISNFRIVKGTAVYTKNFSAPNAPLTNISGTSILTCQSATIVDNSTANSGSGWTITNTGAVTASSVQPPLASYNPQNLPSPALGSATPGVWTLSQALAAEVTRSWPMYDPYYKNVVLNLHGEGTNGGQNNTFLDSSSNNFTITRNGNTTQGSFSPYGSGWGVFLTSGTDLALYMNSQTQFVFGTGDFNFELWVNLIPTGTSANQVILDWRPGATNGAYPTLYLNSTAGKLSYYANTGDRIVADSAFVYNTWTHVAVSRASGTTRMFINGVVQSTTYADSTNYTIAPSYRPATSNGAAQSDHMFGGMISNLRIIKGQAIYTSSFSVPTSPLTTTSQGATAANVSLLTAQSNRFVDNSPNAFTVNSAGVIGTTKSQPFLFNTSYTPSVIGGSGYFDDSGDYLSVPASSSFVASGNFTLECWFYVPTTSGYKAVASSYVNGTGSWIIEVQNSSSLRLYYNGVSNSILSSISVIPNTWTHFAAVRNGTTLTIYINGVSGGTATYSGNFGDATLPILIGYLASPTYSYAGYVSNLRYVVGTAVYTSAFTPPTSPLTAVTNTQLLCNFTNAAIYDNAAMNDLETVGNAQISTSVKKYGTGSMYFDGSGDYLLSNSPTTNLYAFGTGDFTVELWAYFNSVATDQTLFDTRPTSTNGLYPAFYTSGSSSINYFISSTNVITGTFALSTGTWYHVALCRSGTSTKLFINGTQVGSTYSDSNNYLCGSNRPMIGNNGSNTLNPLNGYIDDLRITKGVARYVANFTPPTSQLQDQ